MPNALHINFLKAVENLQLKFPVKEISDKTGYKQPIVSEYLNSKKNVSEKFAKKFCEVYKLDYQSLLIPVTIFEESTDYKVSGNLANRIYNKWLKIAADITFGKPNTETLKEMHELVEQLKKQNDELEAEEE